MDSITVRCKQCQHSMKFSVQKAGKRAKCPKCETIVLIPTPQEGPVPEPPPEAPPPAPNPNDEFDDGKGEYGVFLDPEIAKLQKKLAEEEEGAGKKKKDRKKLPQVGRKIKAIPDAESWSMIRMGMLFIFVGTWIWLGCHLLQGSYVLLGWAEFPEFAPMVARNLEQRRDEGFPDQGRGWDLDWLELYLGMIAGGNFVGWARIALTTASIFYVFQAILWGVGYGFCFPVPHHYGMFGHVIMLLCLVVFNLLMMLLFKLLPVLGAGWPGYVMIPLVTPEIVLTEYNMERSVPINILWSGGGWYAFCENTFCLIFKFLFYLEPTIMSIFVWSAGIAVKDEKIEQLGKGRTQMCLGTFFILIVFHLLSLTGTSPVLVAVLRVIYTLWFFFLIVFMLQYSMMLLKCRAVLYDKIHPKFELDEEEEPRKKKKK